MATYEKHHCWSILLRLFHWMFALSIVFLVVTGFYINNPWTNTMIEGSVSFPMATMRYIHLYCSVYLFRSSGDQAVSLHLRQRPGKNNGYPAGYRHAISTTCS